MGEHIKTEMEIIAGYKPWFDKYKDLDDLPEEIEKEVEKKALTKWVSLPWLKEKIQKLRQWEEVAPEYYDAIKDVLSLLEEEDD